MADAHLASRRPAALQRASVLPAQELGTRGLRSRTALKRAACKLLNGCGYRNLRVKDITDEAAVASGLFYRYFHDLREICAEVCVDFFDELMAESSAIEEGDEPYEWILQVHLVVVSRFAANPGILACLFGLAGDCEEFDAIWKRYAHAWNLRVAAFLQRTQGMGAAQAERMAYMLGAMTEGVIYQALIRRTEDLMGSGADVRDIAEMIAVVWHRAIFFRGPPAAMLGPSSRWLVDPKPD